MKNDDPKPKPSKKDFGDPEVNKMLQKIYEMDGKIKDQVDKITSQAGISREVLYTFFDNPKNFTASQLKKLEEDKVALEKSLVPIMGAKWKQRRQVRKKKVLGKKMKGKTLGGRKGWISMR
jgi:hypothetical protein